MKTMLIVLTLQFLIFFSSFPNLTDTNKGSNNVINRLHINESIYTSELINNPKDSSVYIGSVKKFYFDKKNDFYIELYFKNDKVDIDEYEQITRMGDSIIYQDEENCRTRIPNTIADNYFDLSGLEPLYIYNQENQIVATSHIKRIEYLNQSISPCFVAVFESDILSKNGSYYCIGNNKFINEPMHYILYEDKDLTNKLIQFLNIDQTKVSDCKHYKRSDTDSIISFLNYDTTAFITENIGNNFNKIYCSTGVENISETTFIPIIINGRPVLLLDCYIPESDVYWNSILVFDGMKYKIKKRQRI